MEILLLAGGALVGAVVAWLLARLMEQARQQRKQEWQEQHYVPRALYAEVQNSYQQTLVALQGKTAEAATLQEANKHLHTQLMEGKSELEALQKQARVEFENLANKILEDKSQRFVEINHERLTSILNPLKERIHDFEKKVEETYANETREKTALRTELAQMMKVNQTMSEEAHRLTQALKGDSKVQGDWGELQLETLLEKSGLLREVHYRKQPIYKHDDGSSLRPDYVINLPEDKNFVVDSKVSLTAYERLCSATTAEERSKALAEHTASLARHIADLGGKNYHSLYGINPPDFVFLFVPIEPALSLALQTDATLYDKALAKNVVLVSVSTLLATLRTITFIWKQENQRRNVLEIAKESGALYDKFVGFVDDLVKLGAKLDEAQAEYKASMNKLTTSAKRGDTIVGRIERIKKLGANTTKTIHPRIAVEE